METRSFEIRKVDQDKREVTGIAVPYGVATDVGGYRESFERGAIESHEGVKLFWEHREIIGSLIAGRDTEEGYEVTARIADTTQGRDAYTLLKDGHIDRFSVGFIPVESRDEEGVTVRTKVDLKEVSLVPFPAYAGASVSEVRADTKTNANHTKEVVSEDTTTQNMETASYDDSEIRSKIDSVERDLAVIREGGSTSAKASQFRSAGEFVKALATNDESARNEVRAYTGAVLADSHTSNDWKNDLLNIVDRGRPVLNLFDRGPLGDHGNSVEYPKVNALTGDVAQQAAEGDNLAYLEVGITTATAPVKTYGGYSEISRQAIERSDVSYLDAVLKYQAASYAKVTNAAVVTAIGAATPQTSGVASFALTAATGQTWVSLAVDGIQKIYDNGTGLNADFVLVSPDVWAQMAKTVDTAGRPVFNINGDGSNTFGNANVPSVAGSLAGLPVVVAGGFSAKTLYVASANAVMTWENSGAPVRLQDENIINLTKQFSLYGYMAVGVKNANGLVKATIS